MLRGTALLCSVAFLPLFPSDTTAEPVQSAQAQPSASGVNAYRMRRMQAHAQAYQQRKAFPPAEPAAADPFQPPPMVENKHADPLRVVIPNAQEDPAASSRFTAIVTRSSPEYQQFAGPQPDPANYAAIAQQQEAPLAPGVVDYASEASGTIASTLSDIGNFIVSAISPSDEPAGPALYATTGTGNRARTAPAQASLESIVARDAAAPLPSTAALTDPSPAQPQPTASEGLPSPSAIYSPGVIIKKEVVKLPVPPNVLASATPEQLAAFAPSAGESTAGVNEPLIQLPDGTSNPAPAPALKPLVAPTPPITPAPITVAPAPEPAASPADIEVVTEIIESNPDTPPSSQPAELPPITAPAPAPAPAPAKPAKQVVTPSEAAPPAAEEAASDPSQGLAQSSKDIVGRLPAMADEKPKEPKGLTIDHTKETTDAFEAEVAPPDQETHQIAGVKIEVKTPAMNINYELEKAYNALLSGQSANAIDIYKRVLANDPNNSNALFGLATTYHRAGQIDAARPLYGKILAKDPNNREALNNFLVLLSDEAPQEALTQLEALEKKSPDFSPIPAQMAVIYQKLGDPAKASEKMFKAVALAPENLTYRYNLAIMLDKQRNYPEAARLYKQIVQAHSRGEVTPGNINKIQERLTFLSSNRH